MFTTGAFRESLTLLIAFMCVTFSYSWAQDAGGNDQPNIIFILTDDLGYGDVGVLFQKQRKKARDEGAPWMYTPHLDELAAGGAVLPHHYCAAPVCAPSRASILLGVSQGHANVRDNQFDKALEDNHTMATVLQQAGYATAAIGKWGLQGAKKWSENGDEWPAYPLNRGFDYFLGYVRHGDGHEHYPKEGVYRKPKEVWENRSEISGKLDKCYTADLWTAAAKRWITENVRAKKKAPFFMYLAFDTPHAVLELPTQPYPKGGGLKGGMQWLDTPGHMITTASGEVDSWTHPDYAKATYDDDNNTSTPQVPWPDTYKRYATSVRRIDDAVGDITRLLKDLKIFSNTIIVFSSDNGPSLESYLPNTYAKYTPDFFKSYGPFDGVKRDVWEGGVRMPTIASWPARIPRGRVVEDPNSSYDWLPTFADAAGIAAPARCDGVSLVPSLTGKGIRNESTVYIEYFNNGATPDIADFHPDRQGRTRGQMQMIRMGDYVGVRYNIQSHADNFEIYNVVDDPGEAKNLAENMDSLQTAMRDKVLWIRRPDPAAERPYDNEWIPAVPNTRTGAGVKWKAYEGSFPWAPSVVSLTPVKEGNTAQPTSAVFTPGKGAGALLFEGFVNIEKGGEYTFHLNTSADALLRIHAATVIDVREGSANTNGKILLKQGLHPFRLYSLVEAGKKPLLDLQWEGPGITRQQIPSGVFRHESLKR